MKKGIFRILLSLFFLWLTSPSSVVAQEIPGGDPEPQVLVGALPGNVNVDNTGAASYSLSLSIPPGTAGMQPTLSIAYGSQGGNGILGVGFSLGGLSAIVRAPSDRIHDGLIDGIDFDENDRLMLDGQRLLLVSSGKSYGEDGSEYHTEIESFSKIVLHGAMNSSNVWLEVRTKSGLIHEYGNTADSFVEAEGRAEAFSWALNRIGDTAGNHIAFHYSETTNAPHLLDRIEYTGNDAAGLAPCNEVEFIYEDRDDARMGWLAGSRFEANKRLQKILINGADGYITDYRFAYEYNDMGASVLESIQQFFGSDETPKTVFGYIEKISTNMFSYINGTGFIPDGGVGNVYRNTPMEVNTGDFNGDGLTDLISIYPNNLSQYSWIGLSNGDGSFDYTSGSSFIPQGGSTNIFRSTYIRTMMPDFNGDGMSDLVSVYPNNSSQYSWIGLANGDGTFSYTSGTNFIPVGSATQVYRSTSARIQSGDFNGDGLADLISIYPNNLAQYSWIGLSNGDGTFTYTSGASVIPDGNSTNVFRNTYTSVLVADFNGDGLTDLASVHPNTASQYSWIGLSNGDGTFTYTSGTDFIPNGSAGNVFRNTATSIMTADFNGDGLADIASVHQNNLSQYSWIGLSNGDGTFSFTSGTAFIPNGSAGNVYRSTATRAFTADLNGDGISDLVCVYPNNEARYSWVGLANGDGTFTYTSGTGFIPDGSAGNMFRSTYTRLQTGDFDGDGLLDLASVYPNNDAQYSWIALNNHERCLLNTVTNGYRSATEHGPVTEIEYLPITDPTIYTKGSGAEYPVYDIQAPMHVVSALVSDDGVGGPYFSDYTYANARSHRDRGFLGFQIFESYDRQTQLSQVEYLAHDFPLTGAQLKTETRYIRDPVNDPGGELLKEVENIYLYDKVDVGHPLTNSPLFYYVAQSTERKWELGTTNDLVSEATTYNWFDAQDASGTIPNLVQFTNNFPSEIQYGNISKIVIDYGGGTKQVSENDYYGVDENDWLLGRLKDSVATHVQSGSPSITRTASFDYYGGTGLLATETAEPGTGEWLKTDYFYDGFGNITNKVVSGAGVAARSIQRSVYVLPTKLMS